VQTHWGTISHFEHMLPASPGAPHTFLDMTAGRETGQIIGIINSKSDIWAG